MKRVGNSFKGVLGGFICILFGIIVLWWNEGNNVRNLKTTAEMDKICIDVDSESVDPKNEGKLIATSGKLINEEELIDTTFDISIKTPILKRVVETYQWEEDSDTDDDGHTTYRYKKKWSTNLINSSNFHRDGHDNPKQRLYENEVFTSNDVKVGAFKLSYKQIKHLSTNATYSNFTEEQANKLNLVISKNYLTNSKNLDKPEIGDTRISFIYNNSTDISVLAVQSGDTFTDFVSKVGKSVNRVMDGTHSGKEIINEVKNEDKLFKWFLRFFGILLCIIGIGTILKPISAVTSFIPIFGSLVGSAVGLISFVLGLCIGLFIIAIAWIRFRPLLGIGLLIVIGALIFLLIRRGKKDNNNNQQTTDNPQQTNQDNQIQDQDNQ